MTSRTNNTVALILRVKDIQNSLDFYTKKLGLQLIDQPVLENGKIVRASVGLDTTRVILLPVEAAQTVQLKEDLTRNKPGVGVEFYIGRNDSKQADELVADGDKNGIRIVNEPNKGKWSHKLIVVTDPDGYTISFRKRIEEATWQRPWDYGVGSTRRRLRAYDSIFNAG